MVDDADIPASDDEASGEMDLDYLYEEDPAPATKEVLDPEAASRGMDEALDRLSQAVEESTRGSGRPPGTSKRRAPTVSSAKEAKRRQTRAMALAIAKAKYQPTPTPEGTGTQTPEGEAPVNERPVEDLLGMFGDPSTWVLGDHGDEAAPTGTARPTPPPPTGPGRRTKHQLHEEPTGTLPTDIGDHPMAWGDAMDDLTGDDPSVSALAARTRKANAEAIDGLIHSAKAIRSRKQRNELPVTWVRNAFTASVNHDLDDLYRRASVAADHGSPACEDKFPVALMVDLSGDRGDRTVWRSCRSRTCSLCADSKAEYDALRYAVAMCSMPVEDWYIFTIPTAHRLKVRRIVSKAGGHYVMAPLDDDYVTVIASAVDINIHLLYGRQDDPRAPRRVCSITSDPALPYNNLEETLTEIFAIIPPNRRLCSDYAFGAFRDQVWERLQSWGKLNKQERMEWAVESGSYPPMLVVPIVDHRKWMRAAERGDFVLKGAWVNGLPAYGSVEWSTNIASWGLSLRHGLPPDQYRVHLQMLERSKASALAICARLRQAADRIARQRGHVPVRWA